MNKKIVLLSLAFLLSGCTLPEPKSIIDNQNNGDNQSQSTQQSSQDDQGEQVTQSEQEEIDNLEEYTATIKTSGADFATQFPEHTDFSNAKFNVQLKNFFDDQLEFLYLISSISYNNINSNKYNGVTYLTLGTGYFVKDKYVDGKLTWNSEVKIYKVVIKARAYMNAYPGYGTEAGTTVYQPDYPAHVLLDDIDTDLSVEETAHETIEKTITKNYLEGTNSFSIESRSARVFISEMQITWRG